jgi:hypothetical protein
MPVCDETPQIAMGFPIVAVDAAAGIDEVLGGHPEDLKPEQSGSN